MGEAKRTMRSREAQLANVPDNAAMRRLREVETAEGWNAILFPVAKCSFCGKTRRVAMRGPNITVEDEDAPPGAFTLSNILYCRACALKKIREDKDD